MIWDFRPCSTKRETQDHLFLGDRPNRVWESMVSSAELSEFIDRHRALKRALSELLWESETVAANRVAAIIPPIDDTDLIWKFSIDPGSHTDLQNPAEFSPKGKPVDTDTIADAVFVDAISETSSSSRRGW